MIGNLGQCLSVLIITEVGRDWETFATWYSIKKNLPESTISVACLRNSETPFQMYQWTKRLNIAVRYQNQFDPGDHEANWIDCLEKSCLNKEVLVVAPLVMVISPPEPKDIEMLNNQNSIFGTNAWFLREPNPRKMFNEHFFGKKPNVSSDFCIECTSSKQLSWIVSCKKGCGKWIDNRKGCPFSNASGLATNEMTINESRIIDLWRRMCSLYSAVA